MTDAIRGQAKLSLDDLDRFLGNSAQDSELLPYCDAAAVLSVFDPLALWPVSGATVMPSDVLARMRSLCEVETDGSQTSRWSLSLSARREALKRLRTRKRMKAALEANPEREGNALQRVFERVLEGAPIALEKLPRDDLASLLIVHEWLEGILDSLPEPAGIKKVLRRNDLLAPMRRLTTAGFVGREKELAHLTYFLKGPQPRVPMFVYGPGGVGKSTLLAQFILQQIETNDLPVAYIDIDRPTIRPEHPSTLLLDALGQLQPQLDAPLPHAESVAKELEFELRRHEIGRQLESANMPYSSGARLFAASLSQWANSRTILIVIDTCEEVQFLGTDVTEPFIQFVCELQQLAPVARVVLSGRTLPTEYVAHAFPEVLRMRHSVDDPFPVELFPEHQGPVALDVLDKRSARRLLTTSIEAAGMPPVTDQDLDDIIHVVSRNPMCLKLAARLLREEGIAALREDRAALLTKLRAEKIQALLYGRILHHLHGNNVRKVAYPGLVVRRIDAGVVEKVLAEPCELTFDAERTPSIIVSELAREAALVEIDPVDGSLRHRPDVRRAMMNDLTDHVDASVVESIDRNAVAYYEEQDGPIARGEEIYHRLRLRQPLTTIGTRWTAMAGQRLKGALDELPPEQRLWLAERLGVTLDVSVRESADQAVWEAQAARSADRYLQNRNPVAALKVLGERPERLPRSPLFALEAEAYRFMGLPDEALSVARRGVESVTADGAIDLALELLLKMVVIDEGRQNIHGAEKTLKEAIAVANHSGNRLLRFRVLVTTLRLQRQLCPGAHDERVQLRRDALAKLDEEMLRKLREQPVLLRETAAELAKDDPHLAALAIEILGIEVSSDEQAKTFGRALAVATGKMTLKLIDELQEVSESNLQAGKIRKWVTETLTSRDTRRLGTELFNMEAGDETLHGFREYFRAGVTNTLSVDPSHAVGPPNLNVPSEPGIVPSIEDSGDDGTALKSGPPSGA
ncbi:AAA family ATPase [Noviherbaspirillum sp. 1P10PC]|uniref:AAA family ATPase n=1 Tax=Noviherbaspirillum sp. 1P10PC TaxID=3132292 RepID=UPI00399FE803